LGERFRGLSLRVGKLAERKMSIGGTGMQA
jgi:hypothetical protein